MIILMVQTNLKSLLWFFNVFPWQFNENLIYVVDSKDQIFHLANTCRNQYKSVLSLLQYLLACCQ